MEVTVDITRKDLLLFNALVLPRLRAPYVWLGVFTVANFGVRVSRGGWPVDASGWLAHAGFAATLAIAACAAMFTFCGLLSVLMASRKAGNLGRHHFTIEEDGFREFSEANETMVRWSGVQAVWVAGPYLLVRYNNFFFHVIPRRCFESSSKLDAFAEAARSKWQQASDNA